MLGGQLSLEEGVHGVPGPDGRGNIKNRITSEQDIPENGADGPQTANERIVPDCGDLPGIEGSRQEDRRQDHTITQESPGRPDEGQ